MDRTSFRRPVLSGYLFIVSFAGLALALPASASDRSADVSRIDKATVAFEQIMGVAGKGIPKALLQTAKCIAIFPGTDKPAYISGAKYGKGMATCRTADGWSAPIFLTLGSKGGTGTGGKSTGFQFGGTITDVVMLFMNEAAQQSLLGSQVKLGTDGSVAAGPVGQDAVIGADVKADILGYVRSKGKFDGFNLDGTVLQTDARGDTAMYGAASSADITSGRTAVPKTARKLATDLAK